jgi:cytochrome c oxidase cbb3-type subunit 3
MLTQKILHGKPKKYAWAALLLALLPTQGAFAADAFTAAFNELASNDVFLWGILVLEGILIMMALALLLVAFKIKSMFAAKFDPKPVLDTAAAPSFWAVLADRLAHDKEEERDVLTDHDYDGIQELDNNLPPWWKMLFNGSIAFAVIYLAYYHVFSMGPLSDEEYKQEVAEAQVKIEAYLAKKANAIDEYSVAFSDSPDDLKLGQKIFEQSCAACHGRQGEGGVGPNMTDNYWIHGGDIKDIFRTIKYGVPEKGMISWKSQLTPAQMQNVSSYIITLIGTNPANAKEPQGELYIKEKAETTAEEKDVEEARKGISMN